MIDGFMNWSGGKDSCLALHHILQQKEIDVRYLLTTLNGNNNRISMHGVRNELLIAQAESIGIPLHPIFLPDSPTMESYESAMQLGLQPILEQKITHSIFGDIFLEDLRKYRDEKMLKNQLTGVYPLWKRSTAELLQEFLALGYKTIVVCVDASKLDESFAGRTIDQQFIDDLPSNVDVCGENGEFHTFVYDGPIFKKAIPFEIGERVFKTFQVNTSEDDSVCGNTDSEMNGFWYIDLKLGNVSARLKADSL